MLLPEDKDEGIMEYGEKFKRSLFGGFDREDVMSCLEELQEQSHEEMEKLRIELESLRHQRDTLQIRVDELSSDLQELEKDHENLKEENESLKESSFQAQSRADALQKELSSQKALNSELVMKKNILEENCRRFSAANEQLKSRAEELSGQVDENASLAIGELMVEAKMNATYIMNRAQKRSAEVDAVITSRCEGAETKIQDLQLRLNRVAEEFHKMSEAAVRNIHQIDHELDGCRETILAQIPKKEENSMDFSTGNFDQHISAASSDSSAEK